MSVSGFTFVWEIVVPVFGELFASVLFTLEMELVLVILV